MIAAPPSAAPRARPSAPTAVTPEIPNDPSPIFEHFASPPARSLSKSGNLLTRCYVLQTDSVSIPAQIARALHRNRRLFVLLLLAVTLFAQSAALISENRPHHATEHCCLLCHVSLPFLQTSAPATVAPLTGVQWLASALHVESFYDVFLAISSSRGPPTQS